MTLINDAVVAGKRLLLPSGRRFRRVLLGPAAGCWMSLDLHHELRLYLGVYERELKRIYRAMLKPGMKSFDVGGRDGYSAFLITRQTQDKVVSFECEPDGVEAMRETFRRNDLPLEVVEAFVGSPLKPETTLTLDQAADRYFRPAFIKIDVEGSEGDVLAGAPDVLARDRPLMIIEVHGVEAEAACLEILRRTDYAVEIIDRTKFAPEHRPLSHNRWLACWPREVRALG